MNNKNFVFATFGYIMLSDILIFTFLSIYIRNKYDLKDYVVLIGILLGVFMSGFRFCKMVLKKDN